MRIVHPTAASWFVSVFAWLFGAAGLMPAGSALAQGVASWADRRDVPVDLLSVAEKSGFRATSKYDEVVAFGKTLAERSPRVRLGSLGTSVEGRDLPMWIIADPPVASAEEARKSGKLVALVIGNIHAGEVDGKEGLMILARELALAEKPPAEKPNDEKSGAERPAGEPPAGGKRADLFKNLVILIAPIYNADGNERFSKDNRPGQLGPEDGMGIRENAQGLDLNRDFVKLEAPETRGLVRTMNEWDPVLFIDCHTTNGSFHRHLMTYGGAKNPAGDPAVISFTRDKFFPWLDRELKEKAGIDAFHYGSFTLDRKAWETYPDGPRYGVNSFGMRNRLGLLSESYSYASYEDRVRGSYVFVRAALKFLAENAEPVRKMTREADEKQTSAGREPKPTDMISLRTKAVAVPGEFGVLGYVEEMRDGKAHPTDEKKTWPVSLIDRFEPTVSVRRPFAYVMPASLAEIAAMLQRHGIEVEELREDIELDVEVYTVDSISRAAQPFQNHKLAELAVTPKTLSRRLAAGSYVVRTSQKLGHVAAYLLEPQSADGLAAWNFFDAGLSAAGGGEEYPVARVVAPTPMLTTRAKPLAEGSGAKRKLTFEAVYESPNPPNLNGSPTGGFTWLPDNKSYLQPRDGRLRKVDAATGRSEPFFDPGPVAAALRKIPVFDERSARSIADRTSFRMDDARKAFFFDWENDLYWCRFDGSSAARLTNAPEPEELASFSPDGRFIAFVRANDLYVVDVDTRTERRLTTGGSDTLRNGKADWVYFEEVFGRNWRVYWWSPDSRRIAFMRVDSSAVPVFTIVNDGPSPQSIEPTRYPKAGQPNPTATLHVVSVAGGEPAAADLSGYDAAGGSLITGAGWWPDSSAFYACITNRTQTWLDVLSFPAAGGRGKRLFRETTGAWVDSPPPLKFLADGSFLFSSERTGWKHLYRYGRDGKPLGAVTAGAWEVRGIAGVDPKERWVYFTGTRDSHIGEHLYRVRLGPTPVEGEQAVSDQKLNVQRLTGDPMTGSHRVEVSPDGSMFIDTWSDGRTPPRVSLYAVAADAARTELVRTLDSNPVRAIDEYDLGEYRQFQVPTPDGGAIEAALTLPPGFDETRKYPAWFMTYGGPGSPTISDSWGGGRVLERVIAQAGVVVFRADPRTASGKGAASAWSAYKKLGVPELEDITIAIDWLKKQPWIDGERIGMSGHSYGGFMTAYAMTHSKLFAAGIAGAPVTDWRHYDTIYTERYMLTPQDNPDGYEATSVVAAAKNLHGRLLLIHGLMDDNVHWQNTTRLVRALEAANKPFELMVYPDSRHGIGGRHHQRLAYDFILRTVGGPTDAAATTPRERRDKAIAGDGRGVDPG